MSTESTLASYQGGIKRYFVGSNRRWDRYSRSLVDRVYDLLNPEFFRDWNILLEQMNRAKRGRHFKVPDIFIVFLAKIRAMFNVPFRTLEAIGRMISRISNVPCISYSRLFKRVRKLNPVIDSSGIREEGAIDSSGFKITIRGDYLGAKWRRKRRGWEKLHVIVSIVKGG
jgi:hypothetical protein